MDFDHENEFSSFRGKTPQEKKRLSYERDRRNVYGENPAASRKNIARRKAFDKRAERHTQDHRLAAVVRADSVDDLDDIENEVRATRPRKWRKQADEPLGVVIARQLEHREEQRRR